MEKLFFYLTGLSSNGAYFIIFGVLVACGLGFPLPEDIPLVASGYLVWDGTLQWLPAVLVTMAGVLIGDTILFFFGRKLGKKVLERQGVQAFFQPERIRRTQAYFRKYGDKIIFFARFVAGFRAAAFFLAGVSKMKYRRFLFLDSLAAALSVPIWVGVGYGFGHYFGEEISQILRGIKHLKNQFTLIVFLILAIVLFRAYRKYRKARQLQTVARQQAGSLNKSQVK